VTDPFLAEIRIFPFGFAPVGWAQCNGQLMSISQNTALFSLLGTTFGGDGRTTFGLPNLMGNAPMAPGQGPGLSLHDLGESGGETTVTLLQTEVPAHAHALQADPRPATLNNPAPQNSLARSSPDIYKTPSGAATPRPLSPNVLGTSGGNQPHNNLMPYLTLNFCIALRGIFPARS
jgi:microcystin-dependent protein